MRTDEDIAELEVLLLGRPNGHCIMIATDSDEIKKNQISLPMSAITVKDTGRKEAGFSIIQIAMPQSLAERKGLC
jgi:hypothetical protein